MLCEIKLSGRTYAYSVASRRDADNSAKLHALPDINPDPFGRCEEHGHITASALVVDAAREHVLLVHHARLDLWLPPGGHCDSDPDLIRVCRREVAEETGYDHLVPLSEAILDIDIHTIPGGTASRAHLHYDVRFAFRADIARPPVLSAESKDLRWVPIPEIGRFTDLPSVLVLTEKLRTL